MSDYYKEDTVYFHCFPSGEDSGFFNGVEAWIDALAAGRMLVCAGDKIKIVLFGAAINSELLDFLRNELNVPIAKKENILFLPVSIASDIEGAQRNKLIKDGLKELVDSGKLVMSQPYFDKDFNDIYCISPELIMRLNDKSYLFEYVPPEFLPKRYHQFDNGEIFEKDNTKLPIPCVIKVAASSGGDGVRVCRTAADIDEAKNAFRKMNGIIIVEEFVSSLSNLCVHFGVPFDASRPMEIIGASEQLTSGSGGFLGGVVNFAKKQPKMEEIKDLMLKRILPRIREEGWYGVGGVDLLVGTNGGIYVMDFNFRLNATTPYLFQTKNGDIKRPVISFTGTFYGDENAFKKSIVPFAKMGSPSQILDVISIIRFKDSYRFNCGMFFGDEESKAKNARTLLDVGIHAEVLGTCTSAY